jgi:hypothetical protein
VKISGGVSNLSFSFRGNDIVREALGLLRAVWALTHLLLVSQPSRRDKLAAYVGTPPAETLKAIERASGLAPGREDYVFLHAQVLAQMDAYPEAAKVLRSLIATTPGPEVREAARTCRGRSRTTRG